MREFDFEHNSIVEIINEIIMDAINKKASDIHFDPTKDFLMVRIRIDGELKDYAKIPNDLKKNVVTRIKIISGMNITETRLPQDGAIKNALDNTSLDLRVSSLPVVNGEKMVIRILDYSMSLNGLENLGFSKNNLKKVNKMIKNENGLILVTGATGTGKSTTVYALLQKLNTKDKGKVLDGESLLESLADNSQIIHVKGGKTIDDKSTKKVARTKKDGVSANRKDRDDKEAR